MRYSLLLHYPELTDGEISDEAMSAARAGFARYVEDLTAAEALVSAEILQPSSATTGLSIKDGDTVIQDGPFADTKEQLAGVFVIDVPDLDAALTWAAQCPAAQWGTIEIRPSAIHVVAGAWIPST